MIVQPYAIMHLARLQHMLRHGPVTRGGQLISHQPPGMHLLVDL